MSLFSSNRLKRKQLSVQKLKLRSQTQSTGQMTDRTIKTSRTAQTQVTKHLPFTIKKQLFPQSQSKTIMKVKAESQQAINFYQQKQRMYHSLESKIERKQSVKFFNEQDQQRKTNKSQRYKTQTENNSERKIQFPIEFKSSSDKNKFSNTQIRSYGVSTCKGQKNMVNTHLILINLGLIKQFYLIQCIDGFQSGNYVKKNLSYLLLKQYLNEMQKSTTKNKLNCLQSAIHRTFCIIKHQLRKIQKQKSQNSGCFVAGILVVQNFVLIVNCGSGTSVVYTKSGKFMKGCEPHTTSNEKQMKRIVSSGGQVYRTQFNVKYKQKISLKGPLRLYPSGHTFTRVLGKTLDKLTEINHFHPEVNPQLVQKQAALITDPETSYVFSEDLQFCIVCSSGLEEFMKMSLLCSIVLHEVQKFSLTFTIHDIASECSRQILHQAYLRGYNRTASCIVIFFGLDLNALSKVKQQEKLKQQPFNSALKYVGKRKSFCKYASA